MLAPLSSFLVMIYAWRLPSDSERNNDGVTTLIEWTYAIAHYGSIVMLIIFFVAGNGGSGSDSSTCYDTRGSYPC